MQVQEFYGFNPIKNNDMNTELEYQKETGLPSRKRNTGNPHSYTNEYIEWLEQQVKLLHFHVVVRSEQLVICKKCGSSEMYQYTKTKDKCEECGNIQDY